MKKPKLKAHLWTIRINDGWSEYEYRLPATNGNASIYDIYEMVRKKLKAKKCDGKYIPATSIPR